MAEIVIHRLIRVLIEAIQVIILIQMRQIGGETFVAADIASLQTLYDTLEELL